MNSERKSVLILVVRCFVFHSWLTVNFELFRGPASQLLVKHSESSNLNRSRAISSSTFHLAMYSTPRSYIELNLEEEKRMRRRRYSNQLTNLTATKWPKVLPPFSFPRSSSSSLSLLLIPILLIQRTLALISSLPSSPFKKWPRGCFSLLTFKWWELLIFLRKRIGFHNILSF